MISLTSFAIRCGFPFVSFIIFMLIFMCILKEWMFTYFSNYLLPEKIINEFDYIVVGSGSAGSIVALRLAENSNNTVLVLEAGICAGILFDIPGLTPLLQKSLVDWHYSTVPQKHGGWALKNNISNWPMGSIYGGTSRLNSMIYARGHPSDFKSWFKNDSNYLYEKHILSYFMKAEDQRGRYKSSQLHSTGGPLAVDDLPFITPFAQHFLDAVSSLNFSIHDLNGGENRGLWGVIS
ncbi:glucose dehydrogenase [FAD, quinone]-like isoform X2 [Agrilus planipennis]|uniref:Glucose dehydrogenase [FAD, quinone]-like isoform X2 n=1 Tax=Agrilus planipennis TaxID=224129 RepID=A0A1W4XKD5_AGRPL|nr:glucose dehydrogenase [FAD, quinone]-like isoform X2 [Agrilus planipennis]